MGNIVNCYGCKNEQLTRDMNWVDGDPFCERCFWDHVEYLDDPGYRDALHGSTYSDTLHDRVATGQIHHDPGPVEYTENHDWSKHDFDNDPDWR